ncbi:MAG: hypothetical protein HY088_03920 [Ignavibacteriales bacterium]|nr:hypothetical protein [Ignavibacteriales bacterium]
MRFTFQYRNEFDVGGGGSSPPTREPADRCSPSLGYDRARESISRTTDGQGEFTFQYRNEFDVGGRGNSPPTRDIVDRGYFFPSEPSPPKAGKAHAPNKWRTRAPLAQRGDRPWNALRCRVDIYCKPPGNIGVFFVGSSPPIKKNRGRESISLIRNNDIWNSFRRRMDFDVGDSGSSPPMGKYRGRESISLTGDTPCWSCRMEAKSYSCTIFGIKHNNRLRASSTGVAVEEFSPNELFPPSVGMPALASAGLALWNFGSPSLSWSVVWWSSLNPLVNFRLWRTIGE